MAESYDRTALRCSPPVASGKAWADPRFSACVFSFVCGVCAWAENGLPHPRLFTLVAHLARRTTLV